MAKKQLIKGITFSGDVVSDSNDSLMIDRQIRSYNYNYANENYYISNTDDFNATQNPTNITIGQGHGVCYGRQFENVGPNSVDVTFPIAGTEFGIVKCVIDLAANVNEHVYFETVQSATAYPTLTKENLTTGGDKFEIELVRYTVDPTSILTFNKTPLNVNITKKYSRNELNDKDIKYIDTDHQETLVEDIYKDIFTKTQSTIGSDKPFVVMFQISEYTNPNAFNASSQLVETKYGKATLNGFMFKMTASTYNGTTGHGNSRGANKIELFNEEEYYEFPFEYDTFDNVLVRDANRNVHADLWVDIRSFMANSNAFSIDVPYRDYISGITFWIADYDTTTLKYNAGDGRLHYVQRSKPISTPPGLASGDGDTLFNPILSFLGSVQSAGNPVVDTQLANMYFGIGYGSTNHPYPNGIVIEGDLTSTNQDQVLAGIIIHFGDKNWANGSNYLLEFANIQSYTPTLLKVETPNIEPEIDNPDRLK